MSAAGSSEQELCVLLMAGGSGLRLWPLSRPDRTKPFLARPGAATSLLAETAARLPFVPLARTFVNVTAGLEGLVASALPGLPADHVIVAPEDRDTLPTLLFATSHIAARFPNATLLLLASDNTVGDAALFEATIARCVEAARSGPHLVSLGISPTEASTRFGYMALGEAYPGLAETWFGTGYVEKPAADVAEALFRGGRHDWNSGIFVWTVDAFRAALEAYAGDEARVFALLCGAKEPAVRAALFRQLRPIAVDHGLLEHVPATGGVVRHVFVRGRFPWDDLGTYDALTKGLPRDADDNLTTPGVSARGCHGCILVTEGPFALEAEGLEDVAVIVSDAGDTLVAARSRLGDIRALLAERITVPSSVDEGGALRAPRPALVRALGSAGQVVEARSPQVVGLLHVQDARVSIGGARVRVSREPPPEAASRPRTSGSRAPPRDPRRGDGPRIFVATDDAELARVGAELVVEALRDALEERDGEALVTMSAGETPSGIYRALAAHHARALPWSRVRLVQMDEWCGLGPDDPRSFAHELRAALVLPLGMLATTLDGRASPDAVLAIEEDVLARGGFALALHGIGTNGHLGFNEPPDDGTSRARRAALAEPTRRAASARWAERGGLASAAGPALSAPAEGLTLGLRSLAHARRTLLVARGAHKAAALGAALARPDAACPASFVPRTGGTDVLVDRAAFAGFMVEGSPR